MGREIGAKLASLRKERNYSQEALAETLRVSRQAISKWERGEASPDTDNLIALARLYKVSLDELVGLVPVKEENASEYTVGGVLESDALETEKDQFTEEIKENNTAENEGDAAEDNSERGEAPPAEESGNAEEDTAKESSYGLGLDFEDEKHKVHIYNGKITVTDKADEGKASSKKSTGEGFPFALAAVILYLLVGFLLDAWHPGWLVFLVIPVAESVVRAVKKKDPALFSYPTFVTVAFLCLGIFAGAWEYAWILYLTVPIYYRICRRTINK